MKRHPLELFSLRRSRCFLSLLGRATTAGVREHRGPLIITVDELAQAGEPAQQGEQEGDLSPDSQRRRIRSASMSRGCEVV